MEHTTTTTTRESDNYQACTDCYYALHGLDIDDDDTAPDREPLGLLPDDAEIADNTCSSHDGDDDTACTYCQQTGHDDGIVEFTWSRCETCGSTLGGARYRLAVWLPATSPFTDDDRATVLHHYLVAGLWSSIGYDDETDETEYHLDDRYDVDDCTNPESAAADIADFMGAQFVDLVDIMENHGATLEQIGHDFLLTRDHHGAGFWDRGYGEVGYRLTAAAHVYGDSGFMPDGEGFTVD